MPFSVVHQQTSFPSGFPGQYQMTDFLPGVEMGQGYFSHQNIASADDCCPCECNCDIFSELFKSRTGASDPANIEFDRSDKRVWTKTGTINLSTVGIATTAVFVGNANLRCETPPLRSDDFCVGITGTFTDPTIGQKVAIKFGSIEAVITLIRIDPGSPDVTYVFSGEIPGTLLTLEFKCVTGISFLAAILIKDGKLSLLANGADIFSPGWGNPLLGQGWSIAATGDPQFTPFDSNLAVPTSGLTSENFYAPSENFVEVETRSMVGNFRLTTFMLHNHQSAVKYLCQPFFTGAQYQCSDLSPVAAYQLDFHNAPLLNDDFTSIVPVKSMNIPGYISWALQPVVGATSAAWSNGTAGLGDVYNPIPNHYYFPGVSFVGSSAESSYGSNWGPGLMVELMTGGPISGITPYAYMHHHTKPPNEGNYARWYGDARTISGLRLYPLGLFGAFLGSQAYTPGSRWVDVTAL